MNLTPEQLNAAHSEAPVIICNAAAGSGKTRTFVERVNWLLGRGAKASDICAVTFTSAAAKEILGRLDTMWIQQTVTAKICFERPMMDGNIEVKSHGMRLGHCGTLHSLMLHLLRKHSHLIGLPETITVMSEDEADQQLADIAARLRIKASMTSLKAAVEKVLTPTDAIGKEYVAAKEFCRQMKQTGELSYDALLVLGHQLIAKHPETAPFKHLLVDESQDNSTLDWRIYKAMKSETRFYVGDHRQSIYGFRGANVHEFTAQEGENCPLTVNFRSSNHVVMASNRIAAKMEAKSEPSQARPGAPLGLVCVREHQTPDDELNDVASIIHDALRRDLTVAVLLRTNRAADIFRNALATYGLPVAQVKPEGMSEDENTGLAILRAMSAPTNDRLVLKLYNRLKGTEAAAALSRQIDEQMTSAASILCLPEVDKLAIETPDDAVEASVKFCSQINGSVKHASFYIRRLSEQVPLPTTMGDLLLEAQSKPEDAQTPSETLHVGTIHSAKGREWDEVILPACEDETLPGTATGEDLEEMRRLFYVAITRAKLECVITWSATRPDDFKKWVTNCRTLSRFAKEVL